MLNKEKDKQNILNKKAVRPPVVVILGHVDHGKSSILEAIKDLRITDKESGGITQHIGAYEVEQDGKKITFIDTPGHEAFSAIRARGANVADIAVLVVAADEGIKPQTREAIFHIQNAKMPMIVAINKIDRPGADPEKVKRDLTKENILVESMGGNIPSVNISAKTKQGINELLEMIILVAEMENLEADLSLPAKGFIIESHLDRNKGAVVTAILSQGILKKGDIVGSSTAVGKVRCLEDFQHNLIEKAYPSMPVVIVGFEELPSVGEEFSVFSSVEEARENLENKESRIIFEDVKVDPEAKNLNLIIKADVLSSLEAIENVLKNAFDNFLRNKDKNPNQEKIGLKIVRAGIGEINESDVKFSIASKAKIIGFRVKTNPIAKKLADREKVSIISFDVIYDLLKAVTNLLEKQIQDKEQRIDLGSLRVLSVFLTEKDKQIIGGKVLEGEIRQGANLEVFREEEKIAEGKIMELQKNKKRVGSVEKGSECGILYKGEAVINEGDILKAYIKQRVI